MSAFRRLSPDLRPVVVSTRVRTPCHLWPLLPSDSTYSRVCLATHGVALSLTSVTFRHLSLGVPAIYVLSILPHLDSGHVFAALAYRVPMLRRVVLGFAALAVGGVVLIGIEIVIALRREYLPTEPALKLDDTFGDPSDDAVTLVVMGDSTAAGLGAGEPANAYPQLLAQRLASDGFRVDLRVFGLSGARVKDVLDEQLPKAFEAAPDYVFIGIGANDVTHLTSLGEVRSDMAEILITLQDRTEAE